MILLYYLGIVFCALFVGLLIYSALNKSVGVDKFVKDLTKDDFEKDVDSLIKEKEESEKKIKDKIAREKEDVDKTEKDIKKMKKSLK